MSSRRVKLRVDTGSGRIEMTGEIGAEDLPVLRGNDDVTLMDEEQQGSEEHGIEIVTMSHELLLSNSDLVHNNYSDSGDQNVQFDDIEHLDV